MSNKNDMKFIMEEWRRVINEAPPEFIEPGADVDAAARQATAVQKSNNFEKLLNMMPESLKHQIELLETIGEVLWLLAQIGDPTGISSWKDYYTSWINQLDNLDYDEDIWSNKNLNVMSDTLMRTIDVIPFLTLISGPVTKWDDLHKAFERLSSLADKLKMKRLATWSANAAEKTADAAKKKGHEVAGNLSGAEKKTAMMDYPKGFKLSKASYIDMLQLKYKTEFIKKMTSKYGPSYKRYSDLFDKRKKAFYGIATSTLIGIVAGVIGNIAYSRLSNVAKELEFSDGKITGKDFLEIEKKIKKHYSQSRKNRIKLILLQRSGLDIKKGLMSKIGNEKGVFKAFYDEEYDNWSKFDGDPDFPSTALGRKKMNWEEYKNTISNKKIKQEIIPLQIEKNKEYIESNINNIIEDLKKTELESLNQIRPKKRLENPKSLDDYKFKLDPETGALISTAGRVVDREAAKRMADRVQFLNKLNKRFKATKGRRGGF